MKSILLQNFLTLLLFTFLTGKDTFVNLQSKNKDQVAQIAFQSNNKGYILRNFNNDNMCLYNFDDASKIIEFNGLENVSVYPQLQLNTNNLDFLLTFKNSSINHEGVDQWTMLFFDDFQGSAPGWSKSKLSTCGANDNMFLGGHCNLGNEEVFKTYSDIPEHTMVL